MKKLKSGNWTSKELLFLRENYMELTDEELGRCLNRKATAVKFKRQGEKLLRTKHYSQAEKSEIIEMYKNKTSIKQIIKKFGISKAQIYYLVKGVRIKIKNWSEEEKQFLKENYSDKKNKELSKELKRTPWGIIGFAYRNGLKKSPEHIQIIRKENAINWKRYWY